MNSTPIRQNGEASNRVNDSSLAAKNRPRIDLPNVQIKWSQEQSRMTQMGGLAYFVNFLVATGLFDDLVENAPLAYESNNAPQRRDIIGAMLLSVLSGHTRYAHMSALGRDKVDAGLLGMSKIPSEDSIRSALRKMLESEEAQEKTNQWLDQCFERVCEGSLEGALGAGCRCHSEAFVW